MTGHNRYMCRRNWLVERLPAAPPPCADLFALEGEALVPLARHVPHIALATVQNRRVHIHPATPS